MREHGGWTKAQSDAALKLLAGLYQGKIDLIVAARITTAVMPREGGASSIAAYRANHDVGVYWIVRLRGR